VTDFHSHDCHSYSVFILVCCDIFPCPVELRGLCRHSSLIKTEVLQVDSSSGYVTHRQAYNYVHMYLKICIMVLCKCLLNKHIMQITQKRAIRSVAKVKYNELYSYLIR